MQGDRFRVSRPMVYAILKKYPTAVRIVIWRMRAGACRGTRLFDHFEPAYSCLPVKHLV